MTMKLGRGWRVVGLGQGAELVALRGGWCVALRRLFRCHVIAPTVWQHDESQETTSTEWKISC